MAAAVEPTLQELSNKFADSEDELELTDTGDANQSRPDSAAQVSKTEADLAPAQALGDEEEEWDDEDDEDEDWDSEDEELASALEWADLREGELHEVTFPTLGYFNYYLPGSLHVAIINLLYNIQP